MDTSMNLWVAGLLSFIGVLLALLLGRVLKQGDDTNAKLDKVGEAQSAQSVSIAEIKTTLHGENGLAAKVNRMHDERSRAQLEELRTTIMENAELRQKLESMLRGAKS